MTVNVSTEPLALATGSPLHWLADPQLLSVMAIVEYLMSYDDAVPVLSSSPGDVQVKATELLVAVVAARSVTAAGGVVSLDDETVVKDVSADHLDQFSRLSMCRTCQKYLVLALRTPSGRVICVRFNMSTPLSNIEKR